MAPTLQERLAMRGIRVPTSANLSGGARIAAVPIADAPRATASRSAQKLPQSSVDFFHDIASPAKGKALPQSLKSPAKGKSMRQSLSRKQIQSRKRTQPASMQSPTRGEMPPQPLATPPRSAAAKRGRPRAGKNIADGAKAGLESSAASLQVKRVSLRQSPLKKGKRKQAALTQPPTREVDADAASTPQAAAKQAQPKRKRAPQEKKVVREQARLSSPPPRRLLATPQRRASLTNSVSPKSLKWNSGSETCAICCDDVDASDAVRLRCHHGWYCKQCMSRHVEARLDNGTVQQTCPECNVDLPERDLKRMIPSGLMDRLQARSLEQAVAATADLRPCPTPNCPMRVALDADESGQFQCTECRKVSCLRCGAQPYHRRLTCEQHAERTNKDGRSSLMKWMEKTGTKQCPSCHMAVTKQNISKQKTQSAECHKMLCSNCNTKFCFKCLAVLTQDFTCGCTIDKHGFVDPVTGEYVAHLGKPGKPGKKVSRGGGDRSGNHDWRDRAGGA